MAASKETNMFSCKSREDRQLRNDKRPLKNILLNFLRHRNIDELLYSKIAYGVGIIVAFIRGHLSPKHAQQLATYAQRMKEFLGLMLPVCVKAIDETDGMVRNDYVKNAENGLINGIVAYLDRIERENGSVATTQHRNETFHLRHTTTTNYYDYYNYDMTYKCKHGSIIDIQLSSVQSNEKAPCKGCAAMDNSLYLCNTA